MASSYTGLGTELMTTGENAGTWGTTTNTNLQIIEQISGGYTAQSIAGSAQTTTLSVSDGSTGAVLAHRIIEFTGTITGNQVVTIPLDVQTFYIVKNNTSGAYTVQFKYVSGSGSSVTWATTDKGTKLLYAAADDSTDPNLVDSNIGGVGAVDLDGNELTLDADSDTSITASTDDQIDFEISGADDFTMTANAFNVLTGSHATFADSANAKFGTGNDMLMYHDGSNSYITNAQGALKIATETSGIAVTIGHTTSETTIADNLTTTGDTSVGGTLGVTGATTLAATSFGDADITNVGGIALDTITNDGTDVTVDSSGDIVLDADGDQVSFKFGGATGQLDVGNANSGDITFSQETNAKDFVFLQYDNNEVMRISDSNFVSIGGNATSQGIIRFLEDSDNGSNYIAIQSPAASAAGSDFTLTLPEVTGDLIPGIMPGAANFGARSLFVGHSTTGTLSSANDNTALGVSALDAVTSGTANTAIGGRSLTVLTDGRSNTAVGSVAGFAIAGGDGNTCVGQYSGGNITSGDFNTAIGKYASYRQQTGDNNTAVGKDALEGTGNDSHDNNTAVGMDAMAIITTGDGNVALGYQAGNNITTGSGNVVIGNADVSSATGDDQLSISSGDDGSVVWMTGDSSGNMTLAADLTIGDDLLLDSDSCVLKFGDDQDVTLTHTDGTGLTLNSTSKLCFYDTALSIHSSTDGQLDLIADTEIQIAATTIDINGAVDISGNTTFGGLVDINGVADGLVLDANGNTTISSPTDDQIDFEIAGADDFTMTANTFTILSGSTIAIAAGGAITNAGTMAPDITSTGKALVFGL